jgi:LuxR family maltose regulon positive regulatory protein
MAHGGLAHILSERNQLDAALAHVQLGVDQLEQVGGAWAGLVLYRALARVRQAQGNWTDALAALDRAYRSGQSTQVSIAATQAAALAACLQLAQGHLEIATAWAANSGLSPDDPDANHPGLREMEYLSLARVLDAQGNHAEALSLLDRLLNSAEADGRNGSVIAILVLQALVSQTQGDTTCALTCLERALALAEPEGYLRIFVDEGAAMTELLRQAQSRGIRPNYVNKLLVAFGPKDAKRGSGGVEERQASPPPPPPPPPRGGFNPNPRVNAKRRVLDFALRAFGGFRMGTKSKSKIVNRKSKIQK